MKKNKKKYSVRKVMSNVCDKGLVLDNWPDSRKKLTVTEMLEIGIKNKLRDLDYGFILVRFDKAMWKKLDRVGKSISDIVTEYIALED